MDESKTLDSVAVADAQSTGVGEAAVEATKAASVPLDPEEIDRLTTDIVAALKTVYDPEIPSDIYELGLIYKVDIDDDRNVVVDMTLTAPGCPVAGEMPGWVEAAVSTVQGVQHVKVNLVFDPPWDKSRMSDEARLAVNMF
ncbi:MAG: SUF system Fe-S cluster assembly protein [Hyphomicrobium sp.]